MTDRDAEQEAISRLIYRRAKECWSGEFPISVDVADYIAKAIVERRDDELARLQALARDEVVDAQPLEWIDNAPAEALRTEVIAHAAANRRNAQRLDALKAQHEAAQSAIESIAIITAYEEPLPGALAGRVKVIVSDLFEAHRESEAALRQVEKMKRLLTHPHDVDVKQADCPACRWDELAEVTRKYHEAMDVLSAYDKIDHATALAQLAEARREIERLQKLARGAAESFDRLSKMEDRTVVVVAAALAAQVIRDALATPPAPEGGA